MNEMTKALQQCKLICNKYEKVLGGYEEGDLYAQFCDETINMAFLIAACDGYVDQAEINTINTTFLVLCDYNFLAKRFGVDYDSEESFLQKVPETIREVAKAEKEANGGLKCFLTDTRALYNTMKTFGHIIINCNGERLKYEVMVLEYFTNLMLDHIFAIEEEDLLNISSGKNSSDQASDRENEKNVSLKSAQKAPAVGFGDFDIPRTSEPLRQSGFKLKGDAEKGRKEEVRDETKVRHTESDRKQLREQLEEDREILFNRSKTNNIEEINEILAKVDALTGLGNVKKEIHDMVNLLIVQRMREKKGLKSPAISMHLVFTGNPGTGKTTIARMMAKIYQSLGILEGGHLVETDRSGMVSGYMGQTAEKVQEVAESAMGGILFIDEAYTLSNSKEGDYGQEAIDTLLKLMEDYRDNLVVIVAGYTDRMEEFLDSNPGLRSRFNKYIHFEDYSIEELLEIFKKYCSEQDYTLAESLDEILIQKIEDMKDAGEDNFGNARAVRNYFEKVISNQANRIMKTNGMSMDDSAMDELMQITAEDL